MPLQSCSMHRITSLRKQWLLHMLLLISLSPVGVVANISGDGLEEDGWNNALTFWKLQELLLFSWVSVKTVVCAFFPAPRVCFADLCAIEHAMIEGYLVSVLGLCLCRGALWTLQNMTIMATLYPVQHWNHDLSPVFKLLSQHLIQSDDVINHFLLNRKVLGLVLDYKLRSSCVQEQFRLDAEKENSAQAVFMSSHVISWTESSCRPLSVDEWFVQSVDVIMHSSGLYCLQLWWRSSALDCALTAGR